MLGYVFLHLCSLLSWLGATLLYFVVILFLGHFVCRLCLFPGSFWFWRRSLERSRGVAILKYLYNHFGAFQSALENFCLCTSDVAKLSEFIQSLNEIKGIINIVGKNSQIQNDKSILSSDQRVLWNKMKEFHREMLEVIIVYGDENYNLWEFPEQFHFEPIPGFPQFADSPNSAKGLSLLSQCDNLLNFIHKKAYSRNCFVELWYLLVDKTIGHADYKRTEIEIKLKAEQIWIPCKNNIKIDAILIRGQDRVHEIMGDERGESIGPTVLFCNPNAAYYEYTYDFQEQWIEFYTSRGLNIFFWNYRGYGRSQGTPSPAKIIADGECIVEYLKNNRGVQQFILHGESVGGAIAAHLAHKAPCVFLYCDRTFSSLAAVAEFSVGKFGASLLNFFTGWKLDTIECFRRATCYKVLGNDPCDKMILDLASLKSGLSKSVVNKYIDGSEDIRYNVVA